MTVPAPSGPFRVVAFSGSLRTGSSNTALLHLAARVAPAELDVHIVDLPAQLPFYNPDLEHDVPPVAIEWRRIVGDAPGLLIAVPEYNFGPSAVAKNAIDWLTRPFGEHALRDKVIALMTSGGKGGGARVQASIAPILDLLGNTVVDEPVVQIAMGATRISADGQVDEREIVDLVSAKMEHVARLLGGRASAT